MGWPNCTRALVWATVSSRARCAAPTCSALSAMQARSRARARAVLAPALRAIRLPSGSRRSSAAPASRTTASRRVVSMAVTGRG